MSQLAALAFASPLLALALILPSAVAAQAPSGPRLADVSLSAGGDARNDLSPHSVWRVPLFAQVDDAAPDADEAPEEEPADPVPTPAQTAEQSDGADYASQMRQRAEIMPVHRAFGIATWISMLATVTLGMFQYYNLYGFFGGVEDSGCVRGDAIFGQDQCWGQPWVHRTAWITTTALYATTFTLSFMMPDPDHLDEGDSDYANNLRLHKTLRWAHLAGMVAQVFLGLASSQNWFGIDRANDFAAQQALATVHQVIGLGTFGLLTAAGLIMIF